MKDRIILIETSGSVTSVALAEEGKIVSSRHTEVPRSQASLTAPFVDEVLRERGITVRDCDAVCVSKGPGSYTGLRVGSSTAKGLCFGADLPLIAVGTLDTLVAQAFEDGLVPEGCKYIVPMIDARRMEVYSAVFSAEGEPLTEVSPVIVDGEYFRGYLAEGPVLFIGDGALKCREVITGDGRRVEESLPRQGSIRLSDDLARPGSEGANAFFADCNPRAEAMLGPAMKALKEKRFEDTAYFEPFYLKQFVATVSAKKLF